MSELAHEQKSDPDKAAVVVAWWREYTAGQRPPERWTYYTVELWGQPIWTCHNEQEAKNLAENINRVVEVNLKTRFKMKVKPK